MADATGVEVRVRGPQQRPSKGARRHLAGPLRLRTVRCTTPRPRQEVESQPESSPLRRLCAALRNPADRHRSGPLDFRIRAPKDDFLLQSCDVQYTRGIGTAFEEEQ